MKAFLKICAAVSAAAMCLAPLGACASHAQKTVNIEVWTYYNETQKVAFEKFITDFNSTTGRQKGIAVKQTSYSNVGSLAEAVTKSMQGEVGAKEKPDLFQSYPDDLWALDQEYHAIARLDDYFTAKELERFEPVYLQNGKLNGELKLIPFAKSTECLLMNKDAWDSFAEGRDDVSLDMLSTMEGIVRVSEIYHRETGKAFYGRDAMANYILVGAKSLGQEIVVSENGKTSVNLNKDAFRIIYNNYYVPYVKGWFNAVKNYRSTDVKEGAIVAYTGSTSSASNFPDSINVDNDESVPVECYSSAAPKFRDGALIAIEQGAGFAVMASETERESASAEFLKYLTEAEKNTKLAVFMNYLPAVKQTDAYAAVEDALVMQNWKGSGMPTQAERELILAQNAKYVSVYKTALDSVRDATLWASAPTDVSATLRKVFEVCIQGDKTNVRVEGMRELVNATDLRAMIQNGTYSGAPEDYFDTWFAQLERVIQAVVGTAK